MTNKVLTEKDFEWSSSRTYKKSATVSAEKLIQNASWVTENGSTMIGLSGDYLVSDRNSQWTVKEDIFEKTYQQLEDGSWQKTASIEAIPLLVNCNIETLEGIAVGFAGDYLARGANDEIWPIPKDVFESSYSLVVD